MENKFFSIGITVIHFAFTLQNLEYPTFPPLPKKANSKYRKACNDTGKSNDCFRVNVTPSIHGEGNVKSSNSELGTFPGANVASGQAF